MKILVSGDRNWTDVDCIREVLKKYDPKETTLIHGAARGADTIAANVAAEMGFKKILPFKAEWDRYGRAAGPIRNGVMLNVGKPDRVIAFHSNIAESKGTKDMLERAKKAGVPTELHEEIKMYDKPFIDNLTDRARRVMQTANNEAVKAESAYVNTGHLLTAILMEGKGLGAKALLDTQPVLTPDELRAELKILMESAAAARDTMHGDDKTGGPRHSPRLKRAFELSLIEARERDHGFVGTEHLLLGILREGAGVGCTILQRLHIDERKVRQAVNNYLVGRANALAQAAKDAKPADFILGELAKIQESINAIREEL